MVNEKNCLALAEFIEKSEFGFDMDSTIQPSDSKCGCIGGFAAVLWPECQMGRTFNASEVSEKLGIKGPELETRLMFPGSDLYPLITREKAVEVLRQLPLTGKVVWDV